MYICLCHAVTDHAIREAVERGVSTYRELSFATGCGMQCGSCAKTARQLFHEAIEARDQITLEVIHNSALAAA